MEQKEIFLSLKNFLLLTCCRVTFVSAPVGVHIDALHTVSHVPFPWFLPIWDPWVVLLVCLLTLLSCGGLSPPLGAGSIGWDCGKRGGSGVGLLALLLGRIGLHLSSFNTCCAGRCCGGYSSAVSFPGS